MECCYECEKDSDTHAQNCCLPESLYYLDSCCAPCVPSNHHLLPPAGIPSGYGKAAEEAVWMPKCCIDPCARPKPCHDPCPKPKTCDDPGAKPKLLPAPCAKKRPQRCQETSTQCPPCTPTPCGQSSSEIQYELVGLVGLPHGCSSQGNASHGCLLVQNCCGRKDHSGQPLRFSSHFCADMAKSGSKKQAQEMMLPMITPIRKDCGKKKKLFDPCPDKKGSKCDCFHPDGTMKEKALKRVFLKSECHPKSDERCPGNSCPDCPICPIEICSRTIYPKCEPMLPGYGGHVPGVNACMFGKTFGHETREALQKVYSNPSLCVYKKCC